MDMDVEVYIHTYVVLGLHFRKSDDICRDKQMAAYAEVKRCTIRGCGWVGKDFAAVYFFEIEIVTLVM